MIIDLGDETKEILKNIKDFGLDIKFIVVTHRHIDHIGALKETQKATGAKAPIHSDDVNSLQRHSLSNVFGLYYPSPPAPDRLLEDGERLNIDELHFSDLHTLEHDPSGIYLPRPGIVFSGDALFNYNIGKYDLPNGDYHQLMKRIHKSS